MGDGRGDSCREMAGDRYEFPGTTGNPRLNLCQIYAIRGHKQAVTHVNGCQPMQTDFSTVDGVNRRVSTGGAKEGL